MKCLRNIKNTWKTSIGCNGSFQVELSLTAAPNIVSNLTDIVLVLDRSGSMAGSALANLKNGAKAFIDIIDEATDGKTTAGPDPAPIAEAARAAGAVIYCIGLSGSDGVDVSALEDWASKPAASYVVITPNDAELKELFKDLARWQ